MNPSSVDIKDLLEGESSLGLTFGTDLMIGREPATPDDCVTIFDTPGGAPQQTFIQGEDYYYPSIQIRVRNTSYFTGWNLINDIKVLLHNRAQEIVNGTLYSAIICSQEPALLDWDENDRPRFVTTFNIQRR